MKNLIALVGGNPYLISWGLYEITKQKSNLNDFLNQAASDEGCYGDHLQRLLLALRQDAELCTAVRAVLAGQPCPSQNSFFRLRSAGVLSGKSAEDCDLSCALYARYLETHLP